ncbi:MAG: hypothetical protein FWF05_06735 [Oscillospiraceae bacterium]|nr:hypothetical protein [Oscillospiraceae bacterium]
MNPSPDQNGVPLGFGMALAQNTEALQKFSRLTKSQQQEYISGARKVNSKQEMRAYVNGLLNNQYS